MTYHSSSNILDLNNNKAIFEVIEKPEGGYVAACYEENIFAEEDTLEALMQEVEIGIEDRWSEKALPKPSARDIQFIMRRFED